MQSTYKPKPNLKKTIDHKLNAKIEYVSCEMQGWRTTMEDSILCEVNIGDENMLFGVFDGHGGPQVSKFVKNHFVEELVANPEYQKKNYESALVQTFMKMDVMLRKPESMKELQGYVKGVQEFYYEEDLMYAGCTACVALITKFHEIFVANAGDSRCVLSRKGIAYPMSFDHKPDDEHEIKRILLAGGDVLDGRVNGNLNLSRAIGDLEFKMNRKLKQEEQLVIAKPDVRSEVITPSDDFLIIGCDGIWETFSNDEMIKFLGNLFKNDKKLPEIVETLFDTLVAKDITESEDGQDNMSCILIRMNRRRNTIFPMTEELENKPKRSNSLKKNGNQLPKKSLVKKK